MPSNPDKPRPMSFMASHGAFDRGFSNGFDRYSCYLKIRIENGTEFRLPVSG